MKNIYILSSRKDSKWGEIHTHTPTPTIFCRNLCSPCLSLSVQKSLPGQEILAKKLLGLTSWLVVAASPAQWKPLCLFSPSSRSSTTARTLPPARLSGRTRGAQPTTNQTANKIQKHNQSVKQIQPITKTNTTNNCNKYSQQIPRYQIPN